MKKVNSTDPSISPTGTQFVISQKLDCKPLTTVLGDQRDPFSQSIKEFYRNDTQNCVKALLKSCETTTATIVVAKRSHFSAR